MMNEKMNIEKRHFEDEKGHGTRVKALLEQRAHSRTYTKLD